MSVSHDLIDAMAQLVKEGMAFTSETQCDGNTIYIVDSIGLTEDELLLLHQKCALTRDGIRHYLVGRAA
jgi:hypothetical protein